jgi:hypothetical protein
MVRYWRIGLVALSLMVLGGCGGVGTAGPAAGLGEAQPAVAGELVEIEGPLTVRVVNKDRIVQADSDEVFDFLVVNTTDQALPVQFVLEHTSGRRWRTSLCVDKQCLLGDGTEPSVTDPVTLPPYFEQPFQAHLFVDKAAQPGHQSTLTLRVEPLVEAALARSVTLSAQVSQP